MHIQVRCTTSALRWPPSPSLLAVGAPLHWGRPWRCSGKLSQLSYKLSYKLSLFRRPAAYKPFLILLFVFIFQQLSGSYAVIFYAVNVFRDIGVSTNPYIPAIITGLIR